MGKICDSLFYLVTTDFWAIGIPGYAPPRYDGRDIRRMQGNILGTGFIDLTSTGYPAIQPCVFISSPPFYVSVFSFGTREWSSTGCTIISAIPESAQICRCSDDSCRVDCVTSPDGFCCIDHSLTDRLLQVLQN